MRIDNSGRLLVGTTSVGYSGVDLTVGATTDSQNGVSIQTSTTGIGYLLFGDGTGANAYVGQIAYAHSDNSMQFDTAGAERMRITSSGNVGIGTTSPTGRFTVQGAAEGDTYFTGGTANSRLLNVFTSTAGSSANAGHNFKIASGEGEFIFGNNATANVLKIKSTGIDVTGNVGIGTSSPDAPLDITGNRLKIRTARTIANADDNGEVGEISWDANYLYVCVNTDTWKRVALSTW